MIKRFVLVTLSFLIIAASVAMPTLAAEGDGLGGAVSGGAGAVGNSVTNTPTNESGPVPLNPDIFKYNGQSVLPTLGIEELADNQSPTGVVDSLLLSYVINPIFFISAGVAIIVVMYSAFRIITARGEEEGITAAKNTLIWAFAGLGLIMLAYTIVRNVAEIIVTNF